ncbi:MAG TPA: alkaline phosphatase family protein [Rhizomicrobium sp.]|jgi:phospholipase C|nr:alkaline phosphatase family protein [Rhizomicrobium sp.]
MLEIPRRSLLQGAAAVSALAALEMPLGSALAQPTRPSKLTDIDHIIILMKENRSFDHYFGTLSGVRGFDDPTAVKPDSSSVFRQADPAGDQGYVLPFRLDTTKTNAQRLHDLSHNWGPQHEAWNGGAMNNWIPAHRAADGKSGPLTMGFMTRADLPFYYALADAFTLCDGYHCSVFGPTDPNRFYFMTGTIDPAGTHGGPAIDNAGRNYSWETYPERLERAGISWRVYHDLDDYGCNSCQYFIQYKGLPHRSELYENAMRDRPFYELLWDIRTGNIPQVSWIMPPSNVTEHPDYLPAAGEDHTNQVLQALWSNPALWARTTLILNYDENDGLFDHVTPPTPEPDTKDEFVNGLPIGLGYRVPCLVISPFSRGGYLCGQTFDHTSTLRLLETRFGVEVANLSKWRRDTCGDLTAAFGFGEPPRLDLPSLPETAQALLVAEQQAMSLPRPAVPDDQSMPHQEPGTRPRRG